MRKPLKILGIIVGALFLVGLFGSFVNARAGDPMACLEDGGLSNVEEQDTDLWRAFHDGPFYAVIVEQFSSEAEARQAVADATDVYAASAGMYSVTGPLKGSAVDGAEAEELVRGVASCLGG
jgi:hypothetical protein